MKCEDCKYLHIIEPRGFCGHWENDKFFEIKKVIRKCKYYIKKD